MPVYVEVPQFCSSEPSEQSFSPSQSQVLGEQVEVDVHEKNPEGQFPEGGNEGLV